MKKTLNIHIETETNSDILRLQVLEQSHRGANFGNHNNEFSVNNCSVKLFSDLYPAVHEYVYVRGSQTENDLLLAKRKFNNILEKHIFIQNLLYVVRTYNLYEFVELSKMTSINETFKWTSYNWWLEYLKVYPVTTKLEALITSANLFYSLSNLGVGTVITDNETNIMKISGICRFQDCHFCIIRNLYRNENTCKFIREISYFFNNSNFQVSQTFKEWCFDFAKVLHNLFKFREY